MHAFFAGWFLTLGYVCIVALNASALALLFRKIMPSVIEQGYLYTVAGWDVYLPEIIISVTALVVFAVLNIRGTALSGRVQYWACVLMIIAVTACSCYPGRSTKNCRVAGQTADGSCWPLAAASLS
mgnify:CR=1 FL=1